MPARVYVHIGPHKSGTTFIQQVLGRNRRPLSRDGATFAGEQYADQRAGVMELLRNCRRAGTDPAQLPHWQRLVSQVRGWSGPVAIISVENLDNANERAARWVAEAFAPAEVHVVFTPRDLSQVIPAMWHTTMRNRDTGSWSEYIGAVRDASRTRNWPKGLSGQDPRRVLAVWEKVVPRENIHVVTVPPQGSDPGLLWQRFCSVVGLTAHSYRLDVPRVNKSLGTAETELLRRLNERLSGRISTEAYNRWVQVFLSRRVLEPRTGQLKFSLPPEDVPWVRKHAEQMADYLRESGYEVVGDLDELIPGEPAAGAVAPDAATDAQVLDVAVDALAEVLRKAGRSPGKASKRRGGQGSKGNGPWPHGRGSVLARLGSRVRRG
jgi:hypothetical protein